MAELLANFLATLLPLFKSRSELPAEILVLRHQLNVLRRKARHRPRVTSWDRLLFMWLYRLYPSVLAAVAIIEPDILIRLRGLGIRDRPTAPRSPWQNAYVERLIGSVRRECTDHVIVLGETRLRRIESLYASYYNEVARTCR